MKDGPAQAKNLKLTIAYDGSRYHGFQFQLNAQTVQQVLEEKLSLLLGESIRVIGSARTDAGVHAYKQVVSFRTRATIPTDRIPAAARGIMPRDIIVLEAFEVPDSFHARFSATGKLYCYRILNSSIPNPFQRNYAWQVYEPLDASLMNQALQLLVGEHHFGAFQAAGSSARNPVRTLYSLQCERQNESIEFKLRGNGFLYHMVRNIVGTVVHVGVGKLSLEKFKEIFESRDRRQAGITAPATGLYLLEVFYENTVKILDNTGNIK